MRDGEARGETRTEIAKQRRRDPAPQGPQFLVGPPPAPPEAVAHQRVQRMEGERTIDIVRLAPFDGNLEQLAAGIAPASLR